MSIYTTPKSIGELMNTNRRGCNLNCVKKEIARKY